MNKLRKGDIPAIPVFFILVLVLMGIKAESTPEGKIQSSFGSLLIMDSFQKPKDLEQNTEESTLNINQSFLKEDVLNNNYFEFHNNERQIAVKIYSLLGKLVMAETVTDSLSIASLDPGIYLAKVDGQVIRFVKN